MINVAVVGAAGRMGRVLIGALAEDDQARLAAAIVLPGSQLLGVDAGELAGIGSQGVVLTDSLEAVIQQVDVVIDFTTPEYTLENLALCADHGKKIVIGTTGLNAEQIEQLQAAARKTAVVFAPNMSIGVNLMFKLLAMAAQVLEQEADMEIVEMHHRHKVDAPSGTALKMGEVMASATGRTLDECAVLSREGHTGPRVPGTIGFATLRGGDVVGDHTAVFACAGERIEVSHKASDRVIYARGALRAARFVHEQSHGLFDMQAVLGLGTL